MAKIDIRRIKDKTRWAIEKHFIGLFKTYSPFGLNISQREYKDLATVEFILSYSDLLRFVKQSTPHC